MVNNTMYLVVAIIFVIINIALFSKRVGEYLDNNWKDVRCYPHIIPIAGLSKKAPGTGFVGKTVTNFNNCSVNLIKVFWQCLLNL